MYTIVLSSLTGVIFAGSALGSNITPQMRKGGHDETPAERAAAKVDNTRFARYTLTVLAGIVILLAIFRVVIHSVRYIRTLTCLNNDTQRYFRMPNLAYGAVKQHLLYAPLFRRRHLRELHFGWFHMGYVPSRFQSLFLATVIIMNVTLSVAGIEWNGTRAAALSHLRNRTGTLSVINMIPLVVLAGRNNPLISLLSISFDNFNLVHRWFGRIVVLQALAHSVAEVINVVDQGKWETMRYLFQNNEMYWTGLVATVACVAIVLLASSALRHAFYETFLHLHIALVVFSLIFLWKHLENTVPQKYLLIMILLWAAERFIRFATLIYRSVGRGGSKAELELLPGDACRVTLKMARPWIFRPGQYAFITVPSVGLWTSHPFSIAWSNNSAEEKNLDSEKGYQVTPDDILSTSQEKTNMSLIIRRRAGFTDKLFEKAERSPSGITTVSVLVEGPYGGHASLQSYGTVMIFAGGVGITHQVPFVRDLVAGYASGTLAARKVNLVWVIQSPEHLEWIRPWMTTILAMDKRRDILRIQLFVTRPRSTKEIHSPSATVQMFPGKPNVDTLIEMEAENQVGAMGVSVCGTGGLSDDVRAAVRRRQGIRNIDFLEQGFTW
ncbi:MAG: hypothetical protein L6R38_000857 [Xanthoria sp. 2 TBL-2021]|nr:MAG: hypothetical protein L6R38_000857 [Xanthoria sp. 2 TBL-2021]